jgi:2-keto-4-pentenoate hydratase
MSDVDPRVVGALGEQLESWRAGLREGAERVGWKIGLNIPEVQERLGLREPVIGHLTSGTRLEDGATYRAGTAVALRAEAEVALELGHAVDPEAGPDAARDALAGFAASIELVDVGRPPADLEGIVAANVFHRAFVLGPSRSVPPGPGAEARLSIGGEPRGGAAVPGDFAETVRGVARHLGTVGERLEAGDRIMAGALVNVPVQRGDEVVVEIEGLGRVQVAIAP